MKYYIPVAEVETSVESFGRLWSVDCMQVYQTIRYIYVQCMSTIIMYNVIIYYIYTYVYTQYIHECIGSTIVYMYWYICTRS